MKFKQFLLESTGVKFEIPEKLKKNLQITDDLLDVKNWKAKTILGNNNGGKGKMASVGYIGVSLDSNIIIPISRNDEHQNGYEYIDYLIDKGVVPKGKYYTLYALGNNYIYGGQNKKYIEDALIAYKKWLSYGGADLTLKGSGILYTGHLSDFINRVDDIAVDGNVDLNKEGIFHLLKIC